MQSRGVAYVFLAFVAVCIGYAFSHRVGPPLPATEVRIEATMVMDATQVGELQVAVGERGRVFRRVAGQSDWTAVDSGTEAALTRVRFHDQQLGLAVGHDQVIMRTTDGGQSWQQVHADPEAETPLFDVLFVSADYAIATGAYGLFMESRDGGQSWTDRVISELDWHYNSLARLDDNTLLIAGEAGTVLRSTDAGATWSVIEVPYQGSYFGAVAVSAQEVVIFGMRGHVLRSEDAGATFVEVDQDIRASLFGACLCADGKLRLAGQNGMVLTSADGGRTFSARQLEGNPMLTAVMVHDNQLLALGAGGQFLAELN